MGCHDLSDAELTLRLGELAGREREALASLIAHLIEFDKREIYADLGYPSLFSYCTRALGYAEGAAYRRIRAARAADKFPVILQKLEKGDIHLEAVALLSAHLCPENHLQLLEAAKGRTTRDIETLVAEIAPRPDIRDCIRTIKAPEQLDPPLPNPAPFLQDPESPPRDPGPPTPIHGAMILIPRAVEQSIKPLSARRIHFGFTGGEGLLEKLERARELLRHKFPAGALEDIFEEILEAFLARKDPDR